MKIHLSIGISVILILAPTVLILEMSEDSISAEVITDSAKYIPHPPIHIIGDFDFDQQATIEGWQGSGSSSSPYIIQNYDIDMTLGAIGVRIECTTVYFIIRNLLIENDFNDDGIYLVDAPNGIVEYCIITNGEYGIRVAYCYNTQLHNNSISHCDWNVFIDNSNLNIVNDNTILEGDYAITLDFSDNNEIARNSILESRTGIELGASDMSNIHNNTISSTKLNGVGIDLAGNFNNITSNNITTSWFCVFLRYAQNTTLLNNTFYNSGLTISSPTSEYYWNTLTINTSNTVNDKPIYYWTNVNNTAVPSGAGQIILYNCTFISINGQRLNNASSGIMMAKSSNVTISNSTFQDNKQYGIHLVESHFCLIVNNSCINSRGYGLMLAFSTHNVIDDYRIGYCDNGVYVWDSDNNTIVNVTTYNNRYAGLNFNWADDNIVTSGYFTYNNHTGLQISRSKRNEIFNCSISNNRFFGINFITSSSENFVYNNNFMNNTCKDTDGGNWWNKSYPTGGNYWDDYGGIDLMFGPLQNIQGSDGIGDTHYTQIEGNSEDDFYPLMNPIDVILTEYNLTLSEGWNLISLPLFQNYESIHQVLDSIAGKWDYIQVYDALDTDHWKTNATFKPQQLNDLKTLNHKIGFWINITEPGGTVLTVSGPILDTTIISLYAGWNLVGYPSLTTETVANVLWGTGADRVEKFDALAPYRISEVGPTYIMKPGEGYWIHVPADSVWIIDW